MILLLIELFCYSDNDELICNALASLVAATLACPDHSNHLWYHLYSPDELLDTHITGFLVSNIYIYIYI